MPPLDGLKSQGKQKQAGPVIPNLQEISGGFYGGDEGRSWSGPEKGVAGSFYRHGATVSQNDPVRHRHLSWTHGLTVQ